MVQPLPTRRPASAPRGAHRPACGRPTAENIESPFIVILLRSIPLGATYFADKLKEAYVPTMPKFYDRPLGGVAPGAALTP